MSDEETDSEVVISYPSAKVGAITRVKNEITNYTENDASVEVEKLEALRDKLYKKIKSFQDACDSEQTKDAPSEDMEEFKKWRKRHDLGNKIYMNKVEKLIIENDDDYESLSSGESDACPVILVAVIKVGDITVAVIWVGSEVWSVWSRSLRSRSFRSWSFLSVF